MSRRLLAALLLLAAAPLFAAALPPEEVEEDHSLATALVTPHKAWGKGSAGGPVRALCFIYGSHYAGDWVEPGNRLREVVELVQRFDLAADAVFYSGSGANWSFHGGQVGRDRAERLLGQPYDLYVVGGFPLERLPGAMQHAILEKVTQGAGLLLCGDAPSEYLTDRRRIDPAPAALKLGLPLLDDQPAGEVATGYRLVRGRAAWLRYPAFALTRNQPFSWRGLTDYDHRMLQIGRAALWAAGKEGAVAITTPPEAVTLARNAPARQVPVKLTSTGAATRLTLALELRRPLDGARFALKDTAVDLPAGGAVALAVDLPQLRAGEYVLDVIARGERGVEAAGATTVLVDSPFGVETLELDRAFVEPGGALAATATLHGTPPAGSVLRFRCRDSHDRVILQRDVPVAAGQAAYTQEIKADGETTLELRAEALLLTGGNEVDLKQAAFTVPKRRHGRFNFVQWDTPLDSLGYYAWQQMKEAGWEVSLIGSQGAQARPAPPVLAAADVSIVPYSTRIMDQKDENGHMKPVCWNDEPAVTQYVQGIVNNQQDLREHGVFVYSLGDEGTTLGACTHPACLAAYRRWLAEQYGTIDKLNAAWGSTYASFDAVELLDPKDNMETASRLTAPARWFDRQAFARWNLMQFSGKFVRAYEQLDPEGWTGFEGTGGFGDDYDAICGINTFYGPYPGIGDDIVRSIYPRQRVRSNWMGYSKTADALSDAAWRMVMKGMDSIWWWMWDGIGTYRGYIRPTMDFFPATAELTEELRPVRQGLGDLLLNSEVAHSGIAIHYSVASALAGQVQDQSGYASPAQMHNAWTDLTYELGLDFRYLTTAALKRGELTTDEFKVLLLPTAQALSADEAAAIRRFAEAGGRVIADVRPGIYDEHCAALPKGALDDLFGIERTGRDKAAPVEVVLRGTLGKTPLDAALGKVPTDPSVTAAGAQSIGQAGETPLLLTHAAGKGQAVLLNFQLPALKADSPETAAARRLLAALYAEAGAQAPVAVAALDGGPLPFTETRTWRNGDAMIVGTWHKMRNAWFNPTSGTLAGEPVPARLTLPAPRHVYDLRAGKYLGAATTVNTRLRWGRASFFALLPYRLPAPKVTLSDATPARGAALTATVTLDVPAASTARHAVWVEVLDAAGQPVAWGRQPVVLERGRAQVPLRVAYNDAAGRWRVRATELFSGQTAEVGYAVR